MIRLVRYIVHRRLSRLVGGTVVGSLPKGWVPAVAEVVPDARVVDHLREVQLGSPASELSFPEPPREFGWFTRSVLLERTSDFDVVDAAVSPRTGLVWLRTGAILGESYGSLEQLMTWGYAAHDLYASPLPRLDTDRPVLPVAGCGYFHLILENLPHLLRAAHRVDELDLLLWSDAPRYVQEVATLLQDEGALGDILRAPAPVLAPRVRIAGRRRGSGQFGREDVAALGAFATRVAARRPSQTPAERIYVTRAGASRSLANETAISAALFRLGFLAVDPGSLSIAQQMTLFRGASIIVGSHGAGLANLAWCAPRSAVIEIHRQERPNDCYARLSHLAGLDYVPIPANPDGTLPVDVLLAAVDRAIARSRDTGV